VKVVVLYLFSHQFSRMYQVMWGLDIVPLYLDDDMITLLSNK
jgi:hypothetical protein